MSKAIERQLWRYEYGKLAPEMLDVELRTTLDRLSDALLPFIQQSAALGLWNASILTVCGSAFDAAMDAVLRTQYREALRRIDDCERAVSTMRALLGAVAAAEAAEKGALAVYELAAIPRLRRLPAVASGHQLVDGVRQTIVAGHYARASYMAAVCGRLTDGLQEQRDGREAERQCLRAARDDIAALCAATAPLAPDASGDPLADGSLSRIEALFEERFPRLALRLLTELQIEQAGRRRFLRLYQLHGATLLDLGSAARVRAVVEERSWDGAVDHYWGLSIAGHATALETQKQRIATALTALNDALGEFSS